MKGKEKSMNERIIAHLQGRLQLNEIILTIDPVTLQNHHKKQEDVLVITTFNLYFFQGLSIKKHFKVTVINCVTLSANSSQIIFHINNDEQILIQSETIIKIMKNILHAREKYNECKEKLMVMVDDAKNLEQFVVQDGMKSNKLWSFIFKKSSNQKKDRLSGQAYVLQVDERNFALQIGQTMYSQIYNQTRLLYINSNNSFIFKEVEYKSKHVSQLRWIYTKYTQKAQINECMAVRKIPKKSQKHDQEIANALKTYKNSDYNEQIYYAIETETHFQVVSPVLQKQKTCEDILSEGGSLSQKDLRSIFYKLVSMLESNHKIFISLSPKNITITPNGIKISQIFCCLFRQTQINYVAPEELCVDQNQDMQNRQIQLINLWKVGILLYELAYNTLPFPIEYVIYCVKNSQSLKVNFPYFCSRSHEFKKFIQSVVKIDPKSRGGSSQKHWKQKLLEKQWLKGNK